MFILQAANTPQMLRDVEHGPLRQGADDVRARGLPQFPVTLDLKTGTELCCILSGITARGRFTRCTPMSSRYALRAIALSAAEPVKIRGLIATQ
jgi:hypothetical protein